ncbi:MUB1/samB family protein [Pleurotus pulmonarius]|nr:hypothetical protein EYR36_007615 [Pleurotus pulmonarius]
MSGTINLKGKNYSIDGLTKDAVGIAKMLAEKARLHDEEINDSDLDAEEDKEIQTQIHAQLILPDFIIRAEYMAFTANSLHLLGAKLRGTSLQDQPKLFATYVQIFTILPEPKLNPFLRRYLQDKELVQGLGNQIGRAFIDGIQWRKPSGPGHICTLLMNMLMWCDPSLGDDGKACIDAVVRRGLFKKTKGLQETKGFENIDEFQRVEIARCNGMLNAIEELPDNLYVTSTRQHLLGQLDGCGNLECGEEATLNCSRCKGTRYCGRECQKKAWKEHKLFCFAPSF